MLEKISKPHYIFLILCLFWGMLFAILNPPFHVPDEEAHLYKIYGFTGGTLNFKRSGVHAGLYLPKNFTMLSSKYFERSKYFESSKSMKRHYSPKEIMQDLKVNLEEENSSFYIYEPTPYTPAAYFHQFFVLQILKFLNINPLVMMYIIRFTSLLVYALICTLAVKTVPFRKCLFGVCALLPMSLYEAAGISADGTCIALSFLLIAYVLKKTYEDSFFEKRDYLIFAILITLITLNKYAYLPLIFIFFMIPEKKFKPLLLRLKYFWGLLSGLAVYTAGYLFYTLKTNEGLVPICPAMSHNSRFEALKFIFFQPLEFLKMFVVTFFDSYKDQISSVIGKFGAFNLELPPPLVLGFLILLGVVCYFSSSKEEQSYSLDVKNQSIAFGVFFFIYFCIMVSVYILYQSIFVIIGFQGRYILPVLPLFLIIFASRRHVFKNLGLFCVICTSILLCATIFVLISAYYL